MWFCGPVVVLPVTCNLKDLLLWLLQSTRKLIRKRKHQSAIVVTLSPDNAATICKASLILFSTLESLNKIKQVSLNIKTQDRIRFKKKERKKIKKIFSLFYITLLF